MKPDWATRLQRTFARKYDAGFAKGLMFGKAVGARDERDRIVALLEERKALLENPNNHYITAMNIPVTKESAMAITDATIWLIKGENK